MSNDQAKFINSRRRHKNDVAVARQVKIAKAAHTPGTVPGPDIKQPHRLTKRHAMDCGNAQCYLCGNPRKTHKDKLTQQEKRLFQDLEHVTDRHSNGLPADDRQ
jgi:hypothetical protein